MDYKLISLSEKSNNYYLNFSFFYFKIFKSLLSKKDSFYDFYVLIDIFKSFILFYRFSLYFSIFFLLTKL